ncbi:toxin-antitoxin system HicB family antitoxin [Desulfonatronovibrio hydrogenovorans]|uniref:toxin-antitoxin system HicB family antitoxin n=1 Tax=Desulfonatronovibrio hydrogenovorans TaxID=53245 RepID=UPI00068B6EF8|nr:toxin-antitoxin system HicB family antitoxin [Desulfonatronovibrio hydrogenovorans]
MHKVEKNINYYLKLPYKMEILPIPEGEGGGFMATLPELGREVFVGDGDTIEEAIESLESIKNIMFEEYLRSGVNIPEPESRPADSFSGKFVLRVPRILHKELASGAKKENVSLNQYVNMLLSQTNERLQLFKRLTSVIDCHFMSIKQDIEKLSFQINTSDKGAKKCPLSDKMFDGQYNFEYAKAV